MILVDKTILSEMENGNIKVEPFNRDHLGTNSIDLTLNPTVKTYSILASQYGFVDCKRKNHTDDFIIPEDGFILRPGKLYIASTNEYTETLNAVPKLEGKSSLGRLGLFIHVTAGYGDVGFKGTWTLELVATVPIKVYPNMKICQISYHSISDKPLVSYDKKEDAKYSGQIGATASKMEDNF